MNMTMVKGKYKGREYIGVYLNNEWKMEGITSYLRNNLDYVFEKLYGLDYFLEDIFKTLPKSNLQIKYLNKEKQELLDKDDFSMGNFFPRKFKDVKKYLQNHSKEEKLTRSQLMDI